MEFFFYFHFFTESVCFFNRHYAKLKKYENSKIQAEEGVVNFAVRYPLHGAQGGRVGVAAAGAVGYVPALILAKFRAADAAPNFPTQSG